METITAAAPENSDRVRRGVNKTLYIRHEDVALWDKARELAGDKLSQFVTQELRRFVNETEAKGKGSNFERIVLRFVENGIPVAKAFLGRWIVSPEERIPTFLPPDGEYFGDHSDLTSTAVAITPKRNFVVLMFGGFDETNGEYLGAEFHILSSIDQLQDPSLDPQGRITAEVHRRLGVVIEELDI